MNYIIITNNPLVKDKYPEYTIIQVENYYDVLVTARNYIHQGHILLSHPQAGSIKPYETPYRSVIISDNSSQLDFKSLHYIETGLERFLTLSQSMGIKEYNEQSIQDFQVIDESLIRSAIASIHQ